MLREIGNYLIATAIMVACYVAINFLSATAWDMHANYDMWQSLIVTAVQTFAQVAAYAVATQSLPQLKPRHISVPPLLAVCVGVTLMVLAWFLTREVTLQNPRYLRAAAIISMLGWGGFAFLTLAGDTKEQAA